jgi:ubiquinone/menaquinone biosynthesis C-methylase UbiE
MDSVNRFSTKAERYARYRWGYAPEAIQAIFDISGLTSQAVAADIGAGTGLLTRELVGRVAKIYAIEPNLPMRQYAERILSQHPAFISVAARAEATTLPGHSVDLITAGQAIHWFDPQATLKEFHRILKPEGWLAALFHTRIDQAIQEALRAVYIQENGWDTIPTPKPLYGDSHTDIYFGTGNGTKLTYPQTWQESWEEFIGGVLSDSHSPEDTHPAFPQFVSAVRGVFDQFCQGNSIQVHGGTDLVLGQLRKDML